MVRLINPELWLEKEKPEIILLELKSQIKKAPP